MYIFLEVKLKARFISAEIVIFLSSDKGWKLLNPLQNKSCVPKHELRIMNRLPTFPL